VRRALLLAAACVAGLCAPASASAALTLKADRHETPWIRLSLSGGHAGAKVTFHEQVRHSFQPVATRTLAGPAITLPRAAPWRCDRLRRRFVATEYNADGSIEQDFGSVRTPSCRHRFALTIRPRKPRSGGRIRARVRDRWRLNDLKPRLCLTPPGGITRCRTTTAIAFRARRPGGWLVRERTSVQHQSKVAWVRNPRGHLRVVATGDSMIQIVDGFLKRRLGRRRGVGVRSDSHISTGISKPGLLDWRAHARNQARRVRADVTVVFLGANDGFPMPTPSGATADCCGSAWVREYARRARQMMRSYARGGRGLVYWLLLPAARGGPYRPIYPQVNKALRLAASQEPGNVRLIHLEKVFTPGGRYRASMRVHGRRVRVRQGDGIHLNTAGASLAASIVERAMKRDRVLRR
jgi:lysophospholipase L1-like esterase